MVPRLMGGSLVGLLVVMLVAMQAAMPSPAGAQTVPDDTPLRLRWTWPGPVTFCVDTSVLPEGLTGEVFLDWVQQALDSWNATEANVELRLASTTCTRQGNNLRNEVGFETYEEASAEVGRAHSTTQNGAPVEGDITLRLNWETPAHCRISTLVHEFGHVLGFTHSELRTDIMGYGPCTVLQPSAREVAMLVMGYGARQTPLTLASAPPGSSALALVAERRVYPAQQGAYYYTPAVVLSDAEALVLLPPECLTATAAQDEECTKETSLPAGYWPAAQRQNPLPEVFPVHGQTLVRPAAEFGHLARPLAACNAVGCASPVEVRAGELRVSGTGVDFAYLVHPLTDGSLSVQIANVSFYAPPSFLDVPATFEVRTPGVAGTAGRLASCVLSLGEVCEAIGAWGGSDVAVVLVSGGAQTRTGVLVEGVGAVGTPSEPSTTPIAGSLPERGFALALWGGGPVSLAADDGRIGAVFVSQGGVLRGYVVGAPAFVNAAFLAEVGAEIAAGTPVVVMVR